MNGAFGPRLLFGHGKHGKHGKHGRNILIAPVGWAERSKAQQIDNVGLRTLSPTYRGCHPVLTLSAFPATRPTMVLSVLSVFSVAGFDFACLAVFRGYHNAFQITPGVTIAF